jgi:hypothetical protein
MYQQCISPPALLSTPSTPVVPSNKQGSAGIGAKYTAGAHQTSTSIQRSGHLEGVGLMLPRHLHFAHLREHAAAAALLLLLLW